MDSLNEPHEGKMPETDHVVCNNVGFKSNTVPIAIVGMGMKLPGGIESAEDFWEMLINKKDGLTETPETRYNVESFCNDSQPRTIKTKKGYYFPEYLGKVDASFMSMMQHAPARLDPQQTLLMEVIWDCMENANQVGWRGSDIGCYIGTFGGDWLELTSKDSQRVDRVWPVATGDYALSNRVSYEYDLKGPSITVETACSSSVVALHDACLGIQNGDCESAIVGGSSLIFTPTMATAMSDNMVLSPDGICKTFDASADGFGRGEAINALYIKRLDAAIRDNDPIRAVIRGTAANSDGRTTNFSSPSQDSQIELIRKAYRLAGIENVHETAFFECHGTGTSVGDAIETAAVAEVFGERGMVIGSVSLLFSPGSCRRKNGTIQEVEIDPNRSSQTSVTTSVTGRQPQASHRSSRLFSPSNTASFLPTSTLPRRILRVGPVALWCEPCIVTLTVPFERAKLTVPVDPTPWPEDRCERVSVNSFGIGGSNAHVSFFIISRSSYLQKQRYSRSSWTLYPRLEPPTMNSPPNRRITPRYWWCQREASVLWTAELMAYWSISKVIQIPWVTWPTPSA